MWSAQLVDVARSVGRADGASGDQLEGVSWERGALNSPGALRSFSGTSFRWLGKSALDGVFGRRIPTLSGGTLEQVQKTERKAPRGLLALGRVREREREKEESRPKVAEDALRQPVRAFHYTGGQIKLHTMVAIVRLESWAQSFDVCLALMYDELVMKVCLI